MPERNSVCRDDDSPSYVLGLAFGLLRKVDGAVVTVDGEHGHGDGRDDRADPDRDELAVVQDHRAGHDRQRLLQMNEAGERQR